MQKNIFPRILFIILTFISSIFLTACSDKENDDDHDRINKIDDDIFRGTPQMQTKYNNTTTNISQKDQKRNVNTRTKAS